MRFCHQCGHPLSLGVEKYCPNCGVNLVIPPPPSEAATAIDSSRGGKDYYSSTNITGTSGDVFGAGFSGSGNIVGKEVGYTVHGSVINLHVDSISAETLEDFRRVISTSTHIDSSVVSDNDINKTEKVREATTNKQQISQVLQEVKRIGEEKGTEIKEIKAGEIQISSNELALKEIILKGNEHYYKGEYFEAIQAYDKAIQIDPNHADAWNNKGVTLDSLGKYNEAIKAYDKAIQIDPNYANAWNNKGTSLVELGKYNEAIEAYDKALQINPNYANAWYNKGAALSSLGNSNEAIEAFDKAIQIDPNYTDALNGKAWMFANIDKNKEALPIIEKALAIDPNQANALDTKGFILYNLERYQEAITCYDRALAIDPNHADAREHKALAVEKLGEKE